MVFNSIAYLAFLAAAVTIFWLLPSWFRRVFMLAASVGFYATWGAPFVWLPLLMAVIVFLAGKRIESQTPRARFWMWVGIGSVLVPLVLFKYRGFLLGGFGWLGVFLGNHPNSLVTNIIFPVGISFYTFEAIAYLIDVRQGRVKVPSFLDLCLFFFFWPSILCGPIVRARELVPQLKFEKPFAAQFVFDGFDRIIWGLVQKNVIANLLAVWVDKGFVASAMAPSTFDGWFLAIAFGLQIYFDFAAYTNIAIGAARLLGVTLPENFRQPYYAATPPDFWARWHMTLSRWIRDYLFFPLNAKWHGAALPLYASLIGVMGLVGLWHGAGWNFIVWGLLHGSYLVAYRVYDSFRAGSKIADSRLMNVAWRVLTLIGVTAAWVTFRASTLTRARQILSSMLYHFSRGTVYSGTFYAFTLLAILFCVLEPYLLRELNELEDRAALHDPSLVRVWGRPLAYLCGLLLFLIFEEHNAQFIYSQF